MTEHRLVTLFGSDGIPARDWVPPIGDAGHVIFPVEGSRDAMDRIESKLPRVIAHTEHAVNSCICCSVSVSTRSFLGRGLDEPLLPSTAGSRDAVRALREEHLL